MEYKTANDAKASFDDVYNAPTPHEYIHTMDGLGYVIGDHAKPFFRTALDHLRGCNGEHFQPVMLDLGCSYGIGSALVLHDSTYASLSGFLEQHPDRDFESCVETTKEWLRQRPIQSNAKCIGLDQAENAVRFGERTGLLARGIACNLEAGESLTAEEESSIRQSNILMSTGAIGYVGPKTLAPILRLLGKAAPENVGPLIVATVLRMFDPKPIQQCFETHNFRFEKLSRRPLPQRNFESELEQKNTIQLLEERGLETAGLEQGGSLYADVYVGARDSDFTEFIESMSGV